MLPLLVSLEQHLRGSEEQLKDAGQRVGELEGQVASYCQLLEVTQRELEEARNRAREREVSRSTVPSQMEQSVNFCPILSAGLRCCLKAPAAQATITSSTVR